MLKIDIMLSRAQGESKILNLETEGPFRSPSDMVLYAFGAAYKDNREALGMTLEESCELLSKLQKGEFALITQRTGMAIATTFGHVAVQWEYLPAKQEVEMVHTLVSLVTVENHPEDLRKAVVVPVHGIPVTDFHTSLGDILSEDAKQPVAVPTFGPAPVETKQETTWRAFYEGSYLRSWPMEQLHKGLQDMHLMVTVDTHRICSLHGAQNPSWFETLAFSGDYPDNQNPFKAIRSWWVAMGVVPFRNCSGGENGETLAKQQWNEIDNILRVMADQSVTPYINVGETLILGSAAGLELKIKRVYPPFDLFFGEPETI